MTDEGPSVSCSPDPAIMFERYSAIPSPARIAEIAGVQQRAYARVGLRGWSAADIESLMANPVSQLMTACAENGEIRGFLLATVVAGEGELLALAVEPSCQRQNIASRLVDNFVMGETKTNINRLVLEVAATNDSAISFYEILKFHEIAIRRNYYLIDGNRVDARLMERRWSSNSNLPE